MATHRDTVLGMTPVAYWRLGETTGTTAADKVGSHNGTYTNTPVLGDTTTPIGDGDTAVLFDSTDDRVDIPHNIIFNISHARAFTVTFLLYPTSTGTYAWPTILHKGPDNATAAGWSIWRFRDQVTNNAKMHVKIAGETRASQDTSTTPYVIENEWHYYTIVGYADKTEFYRDGALHSTSTFASTIESISTDPFVINSSYGSDVTQKIDEVAFFDKSLTSTQVADLYNSIPNAKVKTQTWTDDFSTDKVGTQNTGTLETGRLRLDSTSTYPYYRTYNAARDLSLLESYVVVEFETAHWNDANQVHEWWCSVSQVTPGTTTINNNKLLFVVNGNATKYPIHQIGGTSQAITGQYTAYDPTSHRWLRIRESAGTVYWDVSPDGVTWTNVNSIPTPSWLLDDNLFIEIKAGNSNNEVGKPSYWDNLNLASDPLAPYRISVMAGGVMTSSIKRHMVGTALFPAP